MPQSPYVWPPDWSEDDFRAIGGFLLYFRAGILQALESVSDQAADQIPEWAAAQRRYYSDAEAVTRWLLSYTPYPVSKGELWNPGKQYYPRQSGRPRSTG